MADTSATIIAASLSSEELEKSINKLVDNVATATNLIRQDFDDTVSHIKKSLSSIGDIKINTGGSGTSKGGTGLKQVEQEAKSATASLDNFAKAQQVAIRTSSEKYRNADTLETMKIQLDILRQRLVETRQQYSSFVAMAANATKTGDEGLYKFATSNVHAFEAEAKSLIQQIRGVQDAILQMGDVIAPQGHLIQNWVASIGKVSPELRQLGEQIKNNSLLAKQSASSTRQSTEEETQAIRRRIAEERQASIQTAANERRRRETIIETGRTAQETSRSIVRDMYKQLNSDSKEPIKGIKDLQEAFAQMKRAWFQLGESDRTSAIGMSLIEDMARARLAIKAIQDYNKEIAGIRNIDPTHAHEFVRSYAQLQNSLKTLTDQYKSLSREERNSAKGTELIDKIHSFNREIRDIQRTMSKPTSLKKALGLDESTLDRINDKLQALRAYKGGLKITDPKQLEEMRQVDAEINRLQKEYDKLMSKNSQMVASNNALGRSWNYMKNRLAFYFTVGASTQFIKNLVEVRSQYEMNERALGILINSAERGTQIFNELSQMALVSPYTLIELSNAAKQLTAYDIAAKDVVETTRRLADMASAVGVPMERLTYALGQIKAYGYLNSRDARMFANAGIPLVRELSKYYSELEGKVVSVGDVYDRMKKKAIDFNSVMAVVTKMTDEGGKFFDFQAKMADTLKVRLANLALAWNNMLNDIGASQQGVLTSSIGILRDLFLHWQDIYGAIQRVVLAIGLWKGAQALALLAVGELNTKMGMQVLLGEKLQTRLSSLASSTKNLVSGYAVAGAALLFVIADAIMTYQRNAEEIEKLNKVIVDGAKESANSIYEFIESAEMSYARLSARTGKLPKPDAEKTWDALREQIELSAISAKDIIPELIKIEDLNERVTKAFNLAERIAEANNKLIDLEGKLDISQNSILFGLFGEGLVEDIDDFNERLKTSAQTEELYLKSTGSVITDIVQGLTGFFNDMKEELGSSTDEAEIEIKNFAHNAAEAIKDELGEEGLKDSIQVNEAVSRVLKGVEQQFPQIKGKGKALFESIYNDIMATEFEGAVDKQAYYYKLFLERLKKDHGSAFQGVTEDIDRETFRWSDAQMKAIQKTADRIKEDIPEAYQDSVTEILNDLNTREFKMRIVAEFATSSLDDINKAFRRRFIEAGTDAANAQIDATQKGLDRIKNLSPWGGGNAGGRTISQKETENLQKFGSLMRKQNESDLDYQERIRKERQKKLDIQATEAKIIAANTGKEEEGAKAVLASAQEQKKAADDWLDAASQVEKWGGYDFSTKKENTAATKAQHAAETELQKALKDELQLIDKVRSQYKKLTDAGANDGEALVMVTNQFANSLAHVNNVLGKNGIPLFDISKFAGTDNPNALLDMLKLQLDSAKIAKNIKPEEIKELEVKYSEIVVDARAYNLTKITKGLNNELDRLKDEYELAVSLDADPELGNMFADWMGIDVNDLPRTASEYAERASKELNKYLKENKANVELPNLLNVTDDDLRAFEEMKVLTDAQLENVRKRVQQARELQKKEASDQIKDWDKLLEKYAEYETKISKIQNDAVKERVTFAQQFGNQDQKNLAINLQTQILAATDPQVKQKLIEQLQELIMSIAGDDKTKLNIAVSINNKQVEELAKASFEQFQKSPEWILATGDLVGMTDKALGGLIDKLEEFKKSAKDLDSKQIKNLNNALKNLYKQRRQGNPFSALINAMSEAKNRALDLQPEIDKVSAEIERLESIKNKGNIAETADELEKLKNRLNELKKVQQEVSKLNTTEWVNSLKSSYDSIRTAIGLFDDLAKAISGAEESDLDKVFKVIDKAVSGAQTGSSFGTYGAIIGAVVGAVYGIVTEYKDVWNGQERINKQLKVSADRVESLATAYNKLQRKLNEAYGDESLGTKKLMALNKEMELAELERQLELEKSRVAKERDLSKISELEDKVNELKYEVENATREMIMDILDISDAQDWADSLVKNMIEAFRQGEDYMKAYDQSFEDMINSMITKAIMGKVIGEKIEELFKKIEKRSIQRGDPENNPDVQAAKAYMDDIQRQYNTLIDLKNDNVDVPSHVIDEAKRMLEAAKEKYENAYYKAVKITPEDVASVKQDVEDWRSGVKSEFEAYMDAFGVGFGSSKEAQSLSALQQGIQGVTETTAGAIEGYMNIVSQQVFLHSELLTQIRDVLVGGDGDIQLGVQAQMLLQLQQSYQVQMAIQGILEGWSTPSGMGVRVELIS